MRQYFTYLKIFFLAIFCASLLLLGSWLPLAGPVLTVSAHSFVIGSEPVDGSTVSKAPSVVRIFFDAPIASTSQANVYAFPPGGPANGLLVNAGQSSINANNSRELDTVLLPANKLPQGGYEVRWTALSLTDGHTTSGLIGFNLGQSSTGATGIPTLGPSTSNYFPQLNLQGTLAVAWDWLVLLALFFWVGIVVTEYFIVPHSASATFLAQARKHSRSSQTLYLAALLAGEVLNLILRSMTFTSTLTDTRINVDGLSQIVLHTHYGWLWLVRVSLLVLALLLLGWNSYRQRQFQDSSTGSVSVSSQASRSFRQLRQQARQENALGMSAKPVPTPMPTRSQARVTDAVAAPARSTTAALPRITRSIETPAHTPGAWQMLVELVLAALVMLTLVLSNEVTQLTTLPISAGVLMWLGLAAQGIWFGCIAYLGLILLPLLPKADPDHHAETLVRTLKCALPWLFSALGVLVVSDLVLGEATIQVPEQLLNDPYGRAFLVRALLILLMLIFTDYTLFYLLPKLQRQTVLLPVVDAEMPARRTRTFALERTERTIKRALHTLTCLAAATLLCVAVMNFFAPPVAFPNVDYSALVNPAPTASNPAPPASQTQQASGLTATLQVLPAHAGVTNTVLLTLSDAQGKAVTDATVKLSIDMAIMNMGTASETLPGGNATYTVSFTASQAFSMAGPWTLQIEVDRPDQPPVSMTFQVLVA